MALYHFTAKILSHSTRNTVSAIAYRSGCQLVDLKGGETFDYRNKAVQYVELAVPKNAPQWIRDIQALVHEDRQKGVQALSEKVEAAEYRINSQVWREIEVALHRELTEEQNISLAREFVGDQLCGRGMTALLNFHFDVDEKTGDSKPHCHILVTMRTLEETGFNLTKERSWNSKAVIQELREQWANYSNFHLKLNGHDIQIDHRSNKERGIEMEPQPKRGRGVLEQEKRIKNENIESAKVASVTDKMQGFYEAQLRNLYRIIRNPDVVLDIVTKHHSTFMWADVQKKLHQYVDDAPLFERLEAKLKNSNELILLGMEKVRDSSGITQDKAIYTTRSMLRAERSLIEHAEELGQSKTYGVQEKHIECAIAKANEELKTHGGLSQDQVKAIHHLVDEGQIKCVVGIAGAGKTTALGVCHEIWKAEGYAVYGLAPTGKAAQNLEGYSFESNGIPSTTLHKFLKSFEEGRCQYTPGSVLVLDEAGMVDVDRFEKLLSAVKQLGVKLIVVGDGAQLQPVEAGPAFRLVTEKLGRSELNTVIRQKEEWQKEATVLFGQKRTIEALKKYDEKGCIHIVEEKLPSLKNVLANKDYEGLVHLYEASNRVSSLIYREMAKDVQKEYPELKKLYPKIKEHEDFGQYLDWKDMEKDAADYILQHADACRSVLDARGVDTLKLALLFKDNRKDKFSQKEEAKGLLKECGLDHLIGKEKKRGLRPGQSVDVRKTTKQELIQSWHEVFKENPNKSAAILAFSNKDVNDLNREVRSLLKDSGHISKGEFIFKIKKEIEDDFKRTKTLQEEKGFSKGDRIVFTKNKYWLGVKNGTMGTITGIDNRKIRVKLDDEKEIAGKELSFSPNLNPYFNHGWAVTIHKSQGANVDRTFVLASFEMTQNLAYVAMTRHREEVKLFGSSLDFWRPEKLPQVLSKSGEKLSAADYLDANTLSKLMKKDDQLITNFLQRMSNELEAMGVVTKQAFWSVADHFLGNYSLGSARTREIRMDQNSIREEVRAEALFQQNLDLHSASHDAGDSQLCQGSLLGVIQSSHQKEKEQIKKEIERDPLLKHKLPGASPFIEASVVEAALKQNMASFADDIFSSVGEGYNRAASSVTERRYGQSGHISVNLKTGAWYDHKDPDRAGGPLHILTKVKGLPFKEAVEYGASWSGLSQTKPGVEFSLPKSVDHAPREMNKEDLGREEKTRKAQALWEKGKSIDGTLAERYLREHRKIESELPKDIRYFPAFIEPSTGKTYPCLMAAARSPSKEVTAVQLTFLDSLTAGKANIPVSKRSFGVIKGSAVTLQEEHKANSPNILFVAEGIETALSLKTAVIKGTIKASLGLSNIKALLPENKNTSIIICADHDAPDSPATKSLNKTATALQEKGFLVTVIKPDKLKEDFNDVLKDKGPQGVREIFAKNLPKNLLKALQNDAERLLQRDSFAKKDQKYSIKSTQEFTLVGKSFDEIVSHCEKRLHDSLARDKKPLTQEHIQRFPLQAEKTAVFLIHASKLNGRNPTPTEINQFSLRAKYELTRIPEIRKKLIKEWKDKDSFKENEGLLAHMIAERLASIEGQIYLKAKLDGIKVPSNIVELAHQELKEHRVQTTKLAEELSQKHSLSQTVSTYCAKDILRYKETHGEFPSELQIDTMVQIAKRLETRDYADILKEKLNHFEVDYYQRREGDLIFRHMSYQKQTLSEVNHSHIQTKVKKSLEATASQISQELIKMNQKEFSL